jgi:hypothetical protein
MTSPNPIDAMQNNRNIAPANSTAKRRNVRPPPKSSLVSDRLGAQGFSSAPRSADLPPGTKQAEPKAEQELGAPPSGKDAWFEQN